MDPGANLPCIDTHKRNSMDYERNTEASQAIILLFAVRLMIIKP